MKYDVLVYNAKIYSLVDNEDIYHNMLVKDGKVAMLVKENYIPDDIDVQRDIRYLINGRGRVIVPSFIVTDIYLPHVMHALRSNGAFGKVESPDTLKDEIVKLSREEYKNTVDRIINTFIANGITASKPLCEDVNDKVNNRLIKDYTKKYKGYIVSSEKEADKNNAEVFDKSYEDVLREINPLSSIIADLNKNYLSSEVNTYNLFRKYTYAAGKELGEECKKGLLREGYDADFIKLDRDPFDMDRGRVEDIHILSTYVASAKLLMINHKKGNLLNNLFHI